MNTKPMRMTWGFVIAMAKREMPGVRPESFSADDLAWWAKKNPELFPGGMTLDDAQWVMANPDAFTDGKPSSDTKEE